MSGNRNIIIGYSYAIVAAALFGSVSTLSKPILLGISPIVLSMLVYLIAGVMFTPVAYRASTKNISRKNYALIFVSGIVGAAIAPIMFFLGLKLSTAADTSLLANGETVFSILFALLLFKEKLKGAAFVGILLILSGVFIVTTNMNFNGSMFEVNFGNILIISATALWGIDNNISKLITRQVNVSRLVQMKSLIGGGISLLVVLSMGIQFTFNYQQIFSIVIVGVFGFAISLYLYLHSIKRLGVVKSSSLLSLSAAFGLAFATIFLFEPIGISQLIAIVIMFIGVYVMYRNEAQAELLR